MKTPRTDKVRLTPHEVSNTTIPLVSAYFAEELEAENIKQAERIANLNKMITRLRDQLTVAIELMESGR